MRMQAGNGKFSDKEDTTASVWLQQQKKTFPLSHPANQGGIDCTSSVLVLVYTLKGFLTCAHIPKILDRTVADMCFLCQLSLTHYKYWLKSGKIC